MVKREKVCYSLENLGQKDNENSNINCMISCLEPFIRLSLSEKAKSSNEIK